MTRLLAAVMLALLAVVAGSPSADAAMAFKAAGYGAAARAGYLSPLDFERLRGPAPACGRPIRVAPHPQRCGDCQKSLDGGFPVPVGCLDCASAGAELC